MTYILTLPYPISANRYWRSLIVKGHAIMVPTKEAKAYKEQCRAIAKRRGILEPIAGPVEIAYRLYPARPQDWQKRMRDEGPFWYFGVRCIDLGNAHKVAEDAFNGTVIVDDKWVGKLVGEKMPPDDFSPRLVVWIRPLKIPSAKEDAGAQDSLINEDDHQVPF